MARLIQGNKVRNLIRVFVLQTRLKGLGDKKAITPKHVHVIGAGTMGGDIAAWCALRGFNVTLQDREAKYLCQAFKRAHKLFNKRLRVTADRNAALDRLIPDLEGNGVEHADVIIEAIFENTEAKHAIFRDVEPRMKSDAVLATNTSSIPLEELASVLSEPDRLVGIHFFNPVAMMPLVEIVKTESSSAAAVERATAFTQHIGKLPLPVKSSPGFLVNRILMPYLLEAFALFDVGVAPEAIDKAATDFGMPMGPVALADTVGLDICLHVAEILGQRLGTSVPGRLRDLVNRGRLGRKSGEGFYRYKKGKAIKSGMPRGHRPASDVSDRMMLRMLNEVVSCLHDGVVEDADHLDAGMVYGTGFAPFRGGPLRYIETEGADSLLARLKVLEERLGSRFKPATGWEKLSGSKAQSTGNGQM